MSVLSGDSSDVATPGSTAAKVRLACITPKTGTTKAGTSQTRKFAEKVLMINYKSVIADKIGSSNLLEKFQELRTDLTSKMDLKDNKKFDYSSAQYISMKEVTKVSLDTLRPEIKKLEDKMKTVIIVQEQIKSGKKNEYRPVPITLENLLHACKRELSSKDREHRFVRAFDELLSKGEKKSMSSYVTKFAREVLVHFSGKLIPRDLKKGDLQSSSATKVEKLSKMGYHTNLPHKLKKVRDKSTGYSFYEIQTQARQAKKPDGSSRDVEASPKEYLIRAANGDLEDDELTLMGKFKLNDAPKVKLADEDLKMGFYLWSFAPPSLIADVKSKLIPTHTASHTQSVPYSAKEIALLLRDFAKDCAGISITNLSAVKTMVETMGKSMERSKLARRIALVAKYMKDKRKEAAQETLDTIFAETPFQEKLTKLGLDFKKEDETRAANDLYDPGTATWERWCKQYGVISSTLMRKSFNAAAAVAQNKIREQVKEIQKEKGLQTGAIKNVLRSCVEVEFQGDEFQTTGKMATFKDDFSNRSNAIATAAISNVARTARTFMYDPTSGKCNAMPVIAAALIRFANRTCYFSATTKKKPTEKQSKSRGEAKGRISLSDKDKENLRALIDCGDAELALIAQAAIKVNHAVEKSQKKLVMILRQPWARAAVKKVGQGKLSLEVIQLIKEKYDQDYQPKDRAEWNLKRSNAKARRKTAELLLTQAAQDLMTSKMGDLIESRRTSLLNLSKDYKDRSLCDKVCRKAMMADNREIGVHVLPIENEKACSLPHMYFACRMATHLQHLEKMHLVGKLYKELESEAHKELGSRDKKGKEKAEVERVKGELEPMGNEIDANFGKTLKTLMDTYKFFLENNKSLSFPTPSSVRRAAEHQCGLRLNTEGQRAGSAVIYVVLETIVKSLEKIVHKRKADKKMTFYGGEIDEVLNGRLKLDEGEVPHVRLLAFLYHLCIPSSSRQMATGYEVRW